MIQTLLAGSEYVDAAKRAAIYSHLLTYVARVKSGDQPFPLPWEAAVGQSMPPAQPAPQQTQALTNYQAKQTQSPEQIVLRKSDKARNYFQSCLLILGLEEEVALTDEALRSAYKRAAVRAHPDKGGSEEAFEAVSRAYAYLGDILQRIRGGRAKEGKVEAPAALSEARQTESSEWKHVKPVKLNPNKLDLNAFNQMFEQTRMRDPDDDGYGDWLKSNETSSAGKAFSGKFNRDLFNQMFEDEARKRQTSTHISIATPSALTLSPTAGVELGRTGGNYTAAANAGLKYTDLRAAYTEENTFSGAVAGVQYKQQSLESYANARKKAPDPLTDRELEAIAEAERRAEQAERSRQLRAAQEGAAAADHFQRMKQYILMDATKSEAIEDRRR